MVRLTLRLNHQVEFGEHIAVLGSTNEFGSWKKKVTMDWTQNGWVVDLESLGGESVEFKFMVVKLDKTLLWESGGNRVVKLPITGNFEMVCQWNKTNEAVDLHPSDSQENEVEVENVGDNGSAYVEDVTSPFVEQWQGKAVSFMRSNEHGSRRQEKFGIRQGLKGFH